MKFYSTVEFDAFVHISTPYLNTKIYINATFGVRIYAVTTSACLMLCSHDYTSPIHEPKLLIVVLNSSKEMSFQIELKVS